MRHDAAGSDGEVVRRVYRVSARQCETSEARSEVGMGGGFDDGEHFVGQLVERGLSGGVHGDGITATSTAGLPPLIEGVGVVVVGVYSTTNQTRISNRKRQISTRQAHFTTRLPEREYLNKETKQNEHSHQGDGNMTAKRGKLIIFEGLDRSGKSTQCERLVTNLRHQGQDVKHLRFPDRTTPIGRMINNYLSGETQQEDHVIHLLFSANRWELAQTIEQSIEQGTTVVVDRYYYSGCVYTAAKGVPGLGLEWCRQPEVGLPRPDVCVFLDITAQAAAARGGYGEERYEKREMQDRVRELFGELRRHGDEGEDIVVLDAGRSVDEVEREIREVVAKACGEVDQGAVPLRKVAPW